jgi:hypothetical protein
MIISHLRAIKCPELEDILEKFDTVEKRAKINVSDYLGKQPLTSPLKTKTDSEYKYYYGEVNADGKEHGRGIHILNSGNIYIGYWENGGLSTGNYILIFSNGDFVVGEIYIKDGGRRNRWTQYNTDGSEK